MIALDDPLPDDLETAHQLIRELLKSLAQQVHLNESLQHQLEQLLRQRYGPKGERIDPGQLLLFAREILAQAEPASPTAATPEPAPGPTTTSREPRKDGHGRRPLPASLPRKPVVHDVPPGARTCPDCGTERTCIGREVREQLEYVPATMVVLEHIRPKYACPSCAAHVVIAERLPEPIEKGLPGPGLMAHVAVSKYADHLPLYRLEGIFQRHGIELARSTMCDWMAVAADLLAPIVASMRGLILASKVVRNDDTPVPVQDHDGKGIKKGRLWVSVGDHDHPYVVYDYTPDHTAAGPREIFKDFKGYLQADAYSGYDGLFRSGDIVEVGCLMHARRKFYEARSNDPQRSHQALAWISLLYDVEREAKGRGIGDYDAFVALRHELRAERSRPIFEKFHAWLEAEWPRVLPKSPIGEAFQYALNHWAALTRPLEAGFLELDNGASERALKPVAIGRRNWLFAGSDRGGQTAAVLMSLCTTCKDLGIDPQAYLRDVLDRVSTHPARRIEELLPDRWQALRQAGDAARS
jgi:transposase